ncbi:hypothetical protein [Nonomuraea sp. NPDC050310]|uniref:hypothetical protein n=1 Tax=unclassified Nonomuraea TaxID=2593643 RepID=UPI0033CFCAD1
MTRRRFRRRATATCAAALAAALFSGPAAHGDPKPGTVEAWERSTSVSLDADGALSDVQALPDGQVWAVGQQQLWDVWNNRGAVRLWNGTAWSDVPVRDTMGPSVLRALSVAAAGEVWAVGDGNDGLPYLTRGGPGGFDRIKVPGLGNQDRLAGIDARPGKMVAVGSRRGHPLIVSGRSEWRVEESKIRGSLYSVSGAFAVGDTGHSPLVMRYSGGSWKPMELPEVPGGYLRDVRADGTKRALAVGGVYHPSGRIDPLVLSWNGKRWKREKLPHTAARLYGVTGDGHGRFWVSGFDPDRPGEPFLLRHAKGETTIIRGGTVAGRSSVRLQSVAYLPGKGLVWAVGHAVDTADRYSGVVETFGPKDPKIS